MAGRRNDFHSTRAWRRLALQVVAEEPVCWLRLPGCTSRSTSADHIIPVSTRPDLALVRSNCRGACKSCNTRRHTTPVEQLGHLRRMTEDQWRDNKRVKFNFRERERRQGIPRSQSQTATTFFNPPPPPSCAQCGTPCPKGRHKYSSDDCHTATDNKRALEQTAAKTATKECPLCGTTYTTTSTTKLYCSTACNAETNARRARDQYRMQQGLPVDPNKPTRPWLLHRRQNTPQEAYP